MRDNEIIRSPRSHFAKTNKSDYLPASIGNQENFLINFHLSGRLQTVQMPGRSKWRVTRRRPVPIPKS